MSSTLRSRPTTSNPTTSNPKPLSPPSPDYLATPSTDPSSEHISRLPSLLDILRLLTGLLLLSTTLSYFITSTATWSYPPPAWTRPARIRAWLRGPITLSPAQLARYDGSDKSLPIYLALNGSVYDVSASPHLYGPGGAYHSFAGKDATRAFVTGCFDTDLTGDLRGVEEMFIPIDDPEEVVSSTVRKVRREQEVRLARKKVESVVAGWRGMFDGGKGGRYFWVGGVDRRGEGWGERRGLCEKAERERPLRGKGERGDGGGGGVRRAGEV
ncbi:MAG: hypothetical protein Q9220_004392 [cf. Caloplaca sp. 1 TL-2023]